MKQKLTRKIFTCDVRDFCCKYDYCTLAFTESYMKLMKWCDSSLCDVELGIVNLITFSTIIWTLSETYDSIGDIADKFLKYLFDIGVYIYEQ